MKLIEICNINGVGIDKKIKEDEIKVNIINYMDVYKNNILSKNISFNIASCTEDEKEKYTVKKFDILLTPSSENKEEICFASLVDFEPKNLLYSYHLMKISPNTNKVNPLFLMYFFFSYKTRKYFYKISQGVTRFTITKNNIYDLEITLPSIENQKNIGLFLMKIDSLTDLYSRKYELVWQLREKLINCEYKKISKTLNDVFFIEDGFPFESSNYTENGIRIITIKNIELNSSNFLGIYNTDDMKCSQPLNNLYLTKGDEILLTITGESGAKFCIPPKNYYVNQRILILRPKDSKKEDILFLLFILRKKINSLSTGNQKNISKKELMKIDTLDFENDLFLKNKKFFFYYNDLLFLYKKKIIFLKKKKQYYLNKIFK